VASSAIEDRPLRRDASPSSFNFAVDGASVRRCAGRKRGLITTALDLDGDYGGEIPNDGLQLSPASAERTPATGGAEVHADGSERVHGHRVAQHVDVAVALGQPLT